jgi:PST family polysaccharide transporter
MNAVAENSGIFVIGLVLAWMVHPAQLGAVAVGIVALLAIRSVAGLGVGRAVAGWRGDPREIAATAMNISVVASVGVTAGFYVAAPAFAAALGSPQAASLVRLLGVTAVISGVAASPRGMLQRRAPGVRVRVDQVGNWLGAAVTIGLAASQFGLMSFAVGAIAGSLVSAGLLIALTPTSVRIGFNRHHGTALLRAALPFAASSALFCGITTADLVVVGHLLHAQMLGLYLLALCWASWPVGVLSQPLRDMAPASFARFRQSPKIARSLLRSSVRLLACVAVPTGILIASAGRPLIHVLYGPDWASAAEPLLWLAPLAVLRAFYEIANDYVVLLVSLRKPLLFQLAWFIAVAPALVMGARSDGMVGAAMYELAVATVMVGAWCLIGLKPAAVKSGPLAFLLRVGLAAAIGLLTLGALRRINEYLALAIGTTATLGVMAFLVYRKRALLGAVRRAAVDAADRPGPVSDPFRLEPGSFIEPSPSPVLSVVPSAPAARGQRPAADSLSGKIRSGARWSMLNAIVMRVSGSIVTIYLARTVFGPRVWGLYAVSQVVLVILLSANELGVCSAIVRWDGDIRTVARTVLTVSVAISTVIYAGLFLAAPYIARALGSPAATAVVRVICVCVIIDGFAGVPSALIAREFLQRRQMVCDSLNFLVSTSVMLLLAFTGHGAMSFALGAVAGSTIATVMYNVLAPYVVLPGWNTDLARRLLRFGLPLAGAALLTLAVFNVDSLIVGATLGPVMLGLYALAFNISMWPVTVIMQAAGRISFAGFSRVADSRERLVDGFTRALAVAMALAVPACVLLGTLAKPFIVTVYGPKWTAAAPVLELLAILGLLRVAYALAYDCLAAGGKRQLLMWIQALWLCALIPVLFLGARAHGIVGVGAGHVLVAVGLVGPAFLWTLRRLGITFSSLWRACARPLVGGALMTATSLLVIHVTRNGLGGLAAAGVAALAVYIPVVLPMRSLLRSPSAAGTASGLGPARAA